MIAVLSGRIITISPSHLIIDVNGVGYELLITLGAYKVLNAKTDITVYTYLSVTENSMTLYGFKSMDEKEIFLKLINVNGIGPKSALTILSGIGPADLVTAIQEENIDLLKSISGIGKKTAERIIIELRDKVGKTISTGKEALVQSAAGEEAVLALISLGYKRAHAEQTVNKLIKENPSHKVEDLIKLALQNL